MIYLISIVCFLYISYSQRQQILTWYHIGRMAYKLALSLPPDDGKSSYTPFNSGYGSIPYRFHDEDRLFLFPRDPSIEIDSTSTKLIAIIDDNEINITPPPGVRMEFVPSEINASRVKIVSNEEILNFSENELVVYPKSNEVYE